MTELCINPFEISPLHTSALAWGLHSLLAKRQDGFRTLGAESSGHTVTVWPTPRAWSYHHQHSLLICIEWQPETCYPRGDVAQLNCKHAFPSLFSTGKLENWSPSWRPWKLKLWAMEAPTAISPLMNARGWNSRECVMPCVYIFYWASFKLMKGLHPFKSQSVIEHSFICVEHYKPGSIFRTSLQTHIWSRVSVISQWPMFSVGAVEDESQQLALNKARKRNASLFQLFLFSVSDSQGHNSAATYNRVI